MVYSEAVGHRDVEADAPMQRDAIFRIASQTKALISVGVNLGVLPTKGLTLPLISSGGSSMLMTLIALGLVLRIKYELDRDIGVHQKAGQRLRGAST